MFKVDIMEEPKQLVFNEIYYKTAKNWYAMPEINGIYNEFEDNRHKIMKLANASSKGALELHKRQVYLIKRRKELVNQRG